MRLSLSPTVQSGDVCLSQSDYWAHGHIFYWSFTDDQVKFKAPRVQGSLQRVSVFSLSCFHLVCTGLAAVATSSVVQRLLGGLERWGGKQGSSRRACSPAETRQDKNILGRTCGASEAAASKRVVVEADLDLLLKHVDLVLLLYQLLLLFGNLRHTRHIFTCWYLCVCVICSVRVGGGVRGTCSCCCRASSICCCCFSSSNAAMLRCSEWAPSSCSLRPLSWLIIITNCSSFSARDSGVPEGQGPKTV